MVEQTTGRAPRLKTNRRPCNPSAAFDAMWAQFPAGTPTRRPGRPGAGASPLAKPASGRARRDRFSEELVLAAEHVADRSVGEDLPDRVGQEVGAGENPDVVRGIGWEGQGVGDHHLLEVRRGQVLPRV